MEESYDGSVVALPFRILLVCTGNTCRSPMAAAFWRAAVKDMPSLAALGVAVDSAGLSAADGSPAASEAEAVMRERGLDLSEHRSRRFTGSDSEADLILTMTEGHKAEVILAYPEAAAKVYTLKEYAGQQGSPDIDDPIGQGETEYRRVRDEIERAVRMGAERLARELPKSPEQEGRDG